MGSEAVLTRSMSQVTILVIAYNACDPEKQVASSSAVLQESSLKGSLSLVLDGGYLEAASAPGFFLPATCMTLKL